VVSVPDFVVLGSSEGGGYYASFEAAEDGLLNALREGKLRALGVPNGRGDLQEISAVNPLAEAEKSFTTPSLRYQVCALKPVLLSFPPSRSFLMDDAVYHFVIFDINSDLFAWCWGSTTLVRSLKIKSRPKAAFVS